MIKSSLNKEQNEVIVLITDEDYQKCYDQKMWSSSKKGEYGRGIAKNPERVGFLGECALYYLFDKKYNPKYITGGDNGIDLIYDNTSYDIKTAARDYGSNCIQFINEQNITIPLKSDVYVFAYLFKENENTKKAIINIRGWLTRNEVENLPTVSPKKKDGKWKNKEPRVEQMRDIKTLKGIKLY